MKFFLFNPLYTFPAGAKHEKYFVRSGSRWPHSGIKRVGELPHYLPFPFFLGYAAAWLRRENFEVAACDCVALDLPLADLLVKIAEEKPGAVFFETATATIKRDLALAAEIKLRLPAALVILSGPHSSVFPKAILEENPAVDFILLGEYEETLVELAAALRDGKPPASVPGLAFRGVAGAELSAPRALIDPLDKLPEPAYDLFPASWRPDPAIYWDGFCQHRPAIQMHASRGCPYKCDFCLWNQVMYHNGKYRVFQPRRVVDGMQALKERYGAREIYFDDDDFTINAKQVEAIADEICARGLDLRWSCMGDAINLSPDLVRKMAASGCVGIKFGVETGSPRLLETLGKPLNLQKVRDVVRWCAACGIKTHATFSLGLFDDDMASVAETLAFMESLGSDTIQVSICTPFPGTRFFDKADSAGLLKTRDWEKYDGKAQDVAGHPRIDLGAVERLRAMALRRWLLRRLLSPGWVLRQSRYFFRVLRGLGPSFMFSQLRAIYEEESFISGE
ncbi:MAG TPA: radical SAM protein [Elusimicrobiales bacterium]|nr:radical SAM protein [Elusimicrobiales bacterium]